MKIYSDKFQDMLKDVRNPYGEGDASMRIVEVLSTYQFPQEPKKAFFDL